jgi:hypothetical protein
MQLSVIRTGVKTHSYFAARQKYRVHLEAFGEGIGGLGYIAFGFQTNPGGLRSSDFSGYIEPKQFEELARLMTKADLQAAIRAFGAAMQDCQSSELFRSGT